MNATPDPDPLPVEKSRRWFTWGKITILFLLFCGFLSFVAYGARESWRVAAAQTGVGIISVQLRLLASRVAPAPLSLEMAVRHLKEDRRDFSADGTGHYNLLKSGDTFIIHTKVLREGFLLKRVVVFALTDQNGNLREVNVLPEVEFLQQWKG